MPIVTIKDSDKTFNVNDGEIIYDALDDRGEKLPHGCLSGSCGACRVEIVIGKENLDAPGAVEQNTIDSLKEEFAVTYGEEFVDRTEIRLACRAKIRGDVTIKPIK